MKKLLTLIAILTLLAVPASAQIKRGALTNTYASSYNVTMNTQTITFTLNSRDITLHNGGSSAVCVNLEGGTILSTCQTPPTHPQTRPTIFQLSTNTSLSLVDYITDAISFKTLVAGTTSSPFTVITTY